VPFTEEESGKMKKILSKEWWRKSSFPVVEREACRCLGFKSELVLAAVLKNAADRRPFCEQMIDTLLLVWRRRADLIDVWFCFQMSTSSRLCKLKRHDWPMIFSELFFAFTWVLRGLCKRPGLNKLDNAILQYFFFYFEKTRFPPVYVFAVFKYSSHTHDAFQSIFLDSKLFGLQLLWRISSF